MKKALLLFSLLAFAIENVCCLLTEEATIDKKKPLEPTLVHHKGISKYQVKKRTLNLRKHTSTTQQQVPCTIFTVITMLDSGESTSHYECDLHVVERPSNEFGKVQYITIYGLNETEEADVISGFTTVYSSDATIQNNALVLPKDRKTTKFSGTRQKVKSKAPKKAYNVPNKIMTATSDGNSTFENTTFIFSESGPASGFNVNSVSKELIFYNTTDIHGAVISTTNNTKLGAMALSKSSSLSVNEIFTHQDAYEFGGHRRTAKTSGVLNVVVLRVSGFDTTPKPSANVLYNKVFGMGGDTGNLRTQLSACSNNLVSFGKMDVLEASLPKNMKDTSVDTIKQEVLAKYAGQISGYDLHLIIMPPGLHKDGKFNWGAYAAVSGSYSVYNDDFGLYADTQLHEVGHNLGLGHSYYKGDEYGDQSCLMGYGRALDDAKKCYNSAHNNLLNWHRTYTCTESLCYTWLVGVADSYNSFSMDAWVNLNIGSGYVAGFNRKKGINSDAGLFPDKVLVHKLVDGYKTDLVAALSEWYQYVVHDFGGNIGTTMTVFVESLNEEGDDFALVSTQYTRRSELFQLCSDYPCGADTNNFYTTGAADWGYMPPQVGNDSLSFVYIPLGWTLQYFEHADFEGITRVFGSFDNAVSLWMGEHNDMASSVKLRRFPTSEQVILCQNDCDTGGIYYTRTGNWASMPAEIGNDQLSWVYLPEGYAITFYVHGNFGGDVGYGEATDGAIWLEMDDIYYNAVSSFIITLV